MDLQRALIHDLGAVGCGNAEHVAASAGAAEMADGFAADVTSAEIQHERERRGIAGDDCVVEAEGERLPVAFLDGHVGDFCAVADDDVIRTTDECGVFGGGLEMIHDAHLAHRLRDDERVREGGRIRTLRPMEAFDRQRDLHAAGDVKECAIANLRRVERGKFLRAEDRALGHEMALDEFTLFSDGLLQRHPEDALCAQGVAVKFLREKPVISKDHAPRCLRETCGTGEQRGAVGV